MGAEMKSTKARGDYRKCMKCGNEWEVVAPEHEPALPAAWPTPGGARTAREVYYRNERRGAHP